VAPPPAEVTVPAAALGVDLGLSLTDVVRLGPAGDVARHVAFASAQQPPAEALEAALANWADDGPDDVLAGAEYSLGVTGGRSGRLATGAAAAARPGLVVVSEPEAIGRGGLHLAGVDQALVVSCGTGTAMIRAAASGTTVTCRHVTGTPVGGGTLQALGGLLLGSHSATEIATLAARGDANRVDTSLGDVLGDGLGSLPAAATAVSFGRLAQAGVPAQRDDVAAALVTMVAQTIALIAVNAVRAEGLPNLVLVGRLATLAPIERTLRAVFGFYGIEAAVLRPQRAEAATAVGAALAARARTALD